MEYWKNVDFSIFRRSKQYREKHSYSDAIGAFDCETSRIPDGNEGHICWMYIWQFALTSVKALSDIVVYGRTWEEYAQFLKKLQVELGLTTEYKLLVYVHNLKYDFSFYKKEIPIDGKFIAKSRREIIMHTMLDTFEVRDSAVYTESPLEEMGEAVGIKKMVGSLNHDLVRTPATPLTEQELKYCENDVLILTKYFAQERLYYGTDLKKIYTATSRVKYIFKRYYYQECKDTGEYMRAHIINNQLDPEKKEDVETLSYLRKAFFGGFVYSNILYRNKPLYNVYSCDIASSYAAQAFLHKFPVGKFKVYKIPNNEYVGTKDDVKQWMNNLPVKKNAMLITFYAKKVTPIYAAVGFLPVSIRNTPSIAKSHANKKSYGTRLIAGNVQYTLCDVDFRLFLKFYNFEKIKITRIAYSKYAPLPVYMMNAIKEMYTTKVTEKRKYKKIKEVRTPTPAEKYNYDQKKSMPARIYGIFCQDPYQDIFKISDGAVEPEKDDDEKRIIQKIAIKKTSPFFYCHGVWIAAWARYELLSIFDRIGQFNGNLKNTGIIYSDTDSLKFSDERYIDIIREYNNEIRIKVREKCKIYNADISYFEGLGEFEIEKVSTLKVLGIKQYAEIDEHNSFVLHVSGLSPYDPEKKTGCTYFNQWETAQEKMEHFVSPLSIPAEQAHNKELVYSDMVYGDRGLTHPILVTDYLGNVCEVFPKSWASIEKCGFTSDDGKSEWEKMLESDASDFYHLVNAMETEHRAMKGEK